MAFEIIGSIAQIIGEVAFAIRYGKSRTTLPNISVPVACITFLFFGLFIGIFSFVFWGLFHWAGPLLFLAVVAGLLLFSVRHSFVSMGFRLSGWLAFFIYAGFFIAGIVSAIYLASTL